MEAEIISLDPGAWVNTPCGCGKVFDLDLEQGEVLIEVSGYEEHGPFIFNIDYLIDYNVRFDVYSELQ